MKYTVFEMPYPCWHIEGLMLEGTEMYRSAIEPLWYCKDVSMIGTVIHAPKAVRACESVVMVGGKMFSEEFGWSVRGFHFVDSEVQGDHAFLKCHSPQIRNSEIIGQSPLHDVKYGHIGGTVITGQDILWNSDRVDLHDCVLTGERIGWYSERLTLTNCTIIGAEPFCHCKNLRLIDCRMIKAAGAFEDSEVYAKLTEPIESIRNPRAGKITVPAAGEIIMDAPAAKAKIIVSCETEE